MRPLTLWTAMGLVASFALMLTLVRAIERNEHGRHADWWNKHAEQWARNAVEHEAVGNIDQAKRSRETAAQFLSYAREHSAKLEGIPRSLTGWSVIVVVTYVWSVALFLVMKAERGTPGPHDPWIRRIKFRTWAAGNVIGTLIITLSILVLALVFDFYIESVPDLWEFVPFCDGLYQSLYWIHLFFGLAGILYFRGIRIPAAIVAFPSICLTSAFFWGA